jgi:hypothetical protein
MPEFYLSKSFGVQILRSQLKIMLKKKENERGERHRWSETFEMKPHEIAAGKTDYSNTQ